MSHEIPRHWRLKQQRYNLVGQKWGNRYVFPPSLMLPEVENDTESKMAASELETRIVLCEPVEITEAS